MAILERGCFCCQLATCVKVQGFFLAVVFFALAVLDLVVLAVVVVPREQNPKPSADDFDRRSISIAKVVCALLLLCLIVWVLLVCMLLYGVFKKKRVLFWPYMVVAGLHVFITLGFLIYYAASVNSKTPNIILLSAILVLQLYLLLHIVSLFQKMGEDEELRPTMDEQQT